MSSGLYSALLLRPGLFRSREIAPSHFSYVSVLFLFQFSFSYVVKPGGPEWGRRRLWAAQAVFRAVQLGAKDLALSAASCIPGFAPLSGSDRTFSGAGIRRRPISVHFSSDQSGQFSSVMS